VHLQGQSEQELLHRTNVRTTNDIMRLLENGLRRGEAMACYRGLQNKLHDTLLLYGSSQDR
jgi:hypothetical protein